MTCGSPIHRLGGRVRRRPVDRWIRHLRQRPGRGRRRRLQPRRYHALLGAIGWALTAWIPLIGPLIALVVWVGVINWRYPGGWVKAALVRAVAWISALVILLIVNSVFRFGIGAFGIPGV